MYLAGNTVISQHCHRSLPLSQSTLIAALVLLPIMAIPAHLLRCLTATIQSITSGFCHFHRHHCYYCCYCIFHCYSSTASISETVSPAINSGPTKDNHHHIFLGYMCLPDLYPLLPSEGNIPSAFLQSIGWNIISYALAFQIYSNIPTYLNFLTPSSTQCQGNSSISPSFPVAIVQAQLQGAIPAVYQDQSQILFPRCSNDGRGLLCQ